MSLICHIQVDTRIGPIYLSANRYGLKTASWEKSSSFKKTKELNLNSPQGKILRKAQQQIQEYFSGQRQYFDLLLDPKGSKFQHKVWESLKDIPFGQTQSYRQIADKVQKPLAIRAVGNANAKNPICLIVPCHRVIMSNGTIGGYSAGQKIKKQLLDFEKNCLSLDNSDEQTPSHRGKRK